MSFPVETMRQILGAIGPRVHGADKAIQKHEAVSVTDCLRRAAFTKNQGALNCAIPVLLSDSLEPFTFDIHRTARNEDDDEMYSYGVATLPGVVGELFIVGATMLQLKHLSLPATLLSSKEGVVVLHVANAPFAALEAEFYDSAFGPTASSIEGFVKGVERGEQLLALRKEAAIKGRTRGASTTPVPLMQTGQVRTVRHGIMPFLSLRIARNMEERQLLLGSVVRMMEVCSVAHKGIDDMLLGVRTVRMMTIFQSENPVPTATQKAALEPSDVVGPSLEAGEVVKRPVLSALALLMLGSAADDAEDANGQLITEAPVLDPDKRYYDTERSLLHAVQGKELEGMKRAETRCSQSSLTLMRTSSAFTLTAVMRGLGRRYDTKMLAKGGCVRTVIEKVALSLFANAAPAECCNIAQKASEQAMALPTALGILSTYLVDEQAIVTVTREPDGRMSSIRLSNAKHSLPDVGVSALSRLVLSTWVFVIIVDDDKVSLLLVTDHASLKDVTSLRQSTAKLRTPTSDPERRSSGVDESSGSIAAGATASVAPTIAFSLEQRAMMASLKRTMGEIEALEERLGKH